MCHKMSLFISLLAVLILSITAEIPEVSNPTVRQFLETYDRSKPPGHASGTTTEVRVGIYINDMRFYSEGGDQVMQIIMYLRTAWKDDRLKDLFQGDDDKTTKRIEPTAVKYFWRPDIFFRNQKASDIREHVTDESLFRVNSTGHVWYVKALIASFSCPDLQRQYSLIKPVVSCPVMIESFSYTMDHLYFTWLNSPVDIDPKQISYFKVADIVLYDCSQNYTAGAFPCVEIRFKITGKHMDDNVGKTLYASSFLLVIAAWGGIWLDGTRHMMARLLIGLATSTVLVMEFGGAAAWYQEWGLFAAKTHYWLAFCTLMTSLSVLEYTLAHVLLPNFLTKLRGHAANGPVQVTSDGKEVEKEGKIGRIADLVFGIVVYPAVFIIFTIVFIVQHTN